MGPASLLHRPAQENLRGPSEYRSRQKWIQTGSRVPLSRVRITPSGPGIKSPWHPVSLASSLRGPCPSPLWHLQPELQ